MSDAIVITLSFIYANATDRQNAVGLTVDDIGKFAKQSDDFTYWELINNSPVTWGALSSSTVNATDVLLSDIIVNEETKLSETVVGIQNIPISPEVPIDGYSLVYDGYYNEWQPKLISCNCGNIQIYNLAPIQIISSNSDQFQPTTTYHRFVSSGGNFSLSGGPTINWPGAVPGQVIFLHNVGAPGNGHITLNEGVSTQLALSNANQRIDELGSIQLIYDGTNWVEFTHTQAAST